MTHTKRLVAVLLAAVLVLAGVSMGTSGTQAAYAAPVAETEQDGRIFAGYYVDEACTIPSNVEGGTQKWVDTGILSVKMQLRTNPSDSSKYDIRLLSTVDTLDYRNVGFQIWFDKNGNGKFEDGEKATWTSKSVCQRITANNSSFVFHYSPKVVDTDSEYFITGIMSGIARTNVNKAFLVEPFWTTLDGTTVYGQSRYFTVQNLLDANSGTNINLSAKMSQAQYDGVTAGSVTGITATGISGQYYDGKYGHFNLTVADSRLLSAATSVGIGGQTVIYRNLANASGKDSTWYTVPAAAGETAFTIATKADLNGLKDMVSSASGAAGKTIYLVADIELNDTSKVSDWSMLTIKQAADAGFVQWDTPAPASGTAFQGTFDGQGHTISGLYRNASTAVAQGLFGKTGGGSAIRNLILDKSAIWGARLVGGIVGQAGGGTIEGVYNGATVTATTHNDYTTNGTGGIVGAVIGSTVITNCQNAGTIKATHQNSGDVGGIVGRVSGPLTVSYCVNTGAISATALTSGNKLVGGIAGAALTGTLFVKQCVSVGTITTPNNNGVGPILGLNLGTTFINYDNYSSTEAKGTTDKSAMYGAAGWGTMVLNDDYYVAVGDGIPELIRFRSLSDKDAADVSAVTLGTATGWYDSNSDATEFVIETEQEFKGFISLSATNSFASKTIKLGADLVLNEGAADWASDAPNNIWAPIGTSSKPFAGTFDGQGHTISELYINAPTTDQIGMFGRVASSAVIKNFELRNSYVCGGNLSGAVIGRSDGCTVESVYTDAVFTSTKQCVGGIVGSTWDGETVVRNCWFAGVMTLTHATPYAGGIVGENRDGTLTVENCLFTGSITASTAGNGKRLGGIVGSALGPGKEGDGATVRYCLATGTMTSNSGNHSYEGPIVGLVEIPAKVTVSDCYATTTTGYSYLYTHSSGYGYEVGSTVAPGQLTGANGYVNTTLDFKDAKYWVAKKGGTPELTQFSTGMALDLAEVHRPDTSWYDTTANKTFELTTKEQLLGFAQLSWQYDFKTQTIKLGADIFINKGDASAWGTQAPESVWTPIGTSSKPFAGTFDGQNHTVSGLYVRSSASDLGLFGSVSGTIRNMRLDNSYLEQTGAGDVGSIVGNLSGNLSNVYSNAMVVTSYSQAGGVIGQVSGGTYTLQDVWYDGAIWLQKGATHAGGIIGDVTGGTWTLRNCLFTGSLDSDLTNGSTYGYVGGVCGSVYSAAQLTLDACVSTGTIRTSNKDYGIGAFVGGLKSGASTLTMTNIFAARDAGFREVGVENDVTVIGKTVWVTASDRLVGYCQEDTDASYSGARLHFPTNWIVRKEGTPVPATFSDRVTEVAASTLNTAIGLDQWKSFASHSLSDAVHYGAGKYVLRFGSSSNDSKSTYTTYVNYLKDTLGFTEYQKNTWDQLENGIYTKKDGDWVLDVLHTDDTGETIITIRTGIEKTLSPNLSSAYAAQEGTADITLTMMPLRGAWAAGNATHGGEGTLLYYYGQSFVFQLPNGHFVLNDGGMRPYDGRCPDLENLIAYLKLLAGTDSSGRQKPVRIDAWTISHQHDDHAGALEGFALYPYLAADVTVEAIYVNEPNNRVMDYLDSTQSPYINVQHRGMRALKTEEGMPTPVYSYQTGEEYWFNGLTMRVIQSQELIPTSDYGTRNMSGKIRGDLFNTVSTVLLFTTAGDEKILISGDANLTNMAYIMSAYGANPTILDGIDVFQAFHHGKNTSYSFTWSSNIFTDYLTDEAEKDFKVVLFPCSKVYGVDENTSFGVYFPHAEACNQYIINNCIAAGGGYYTWKHDGEPDEVIIVTFTAGGITHGSYAIADLVSPMDSPAVSNPGGITFGDPDEIIPGGWD